MKNLITSLLLCAVMLCSPTLSHAGYIERELPPADGVAVGHEYVDLGLPSGLLWANVTLNSSTYAEKPFRYYWGMICEFWSDDYDWMIDDYNAVYKTISTDICGTEYDPAHKDLGYGWKMPTVDQFRELLDNTTIVESYNDIAHPTTRSYLVLEGPNGHRLLLPKWQFWTGSVAPSEDGETYLNAYRVSPSRLSNSINIIEYKKKACASILPVITPEDAAIAPPMSALGEICNEGKNMCVKYADGVLTVTGAADGTPVKIYDLSGRTVATLVLTGGSATLPALSPGIYVASCNGTAQKISIR